MATALLTKNANILFHVLLKRRVSMKVSFPGAYIENHQEPKRPMTWTRSVYDLACALYIYCRRLQQLLNDKHDLSYYMSDTYNKEVKLKIVDVTPAVENPSTMDLSECKEIPYVAIVHGDELRKLLAEVDIDYQMALSLEKLGGSDSLAPVKLVCNLVTSDLVLYAYQRTAFVKTCMTDATQNVDFTKRFASVYSKWSVERDSVLKKQGDIGASDVVVVSGFTSEIPSALSPRLYFNPHLCVAVMDKKGTFLVVRHHKRAMDTPTPPLTRCQRAFEGKIHCVCLSPDNMASSSSPSGKCEIVIEWPTREEQRVCNGFQVLLFAIYEYGTRKSFKIVDMDFFACDGSAPSHRRELKIGPCTNSFNEKQMAPQTFAGKSYFLEVCSTVNSSSTKSAVTAMSARDYFTKKDRGLLNDYIEHIFQRLVDMKDEETGRKLFPNGNASALAQSNPFVFLPVNSIVFGSHQKRVSRRFCEVLFENALRGLGHTHASVLLLLQMRKSETDNNRWVQHRFRELVTHLFRDLALLNYEPDKINKSGLEQMMNICITESGDCEDGAIAVYYITKALKEFVLQYRWLPSSQSSAFEALCATIVSEFDPVVANFRVTSPSHERALVEGSVSDFSQTVSHMAAVLFPKSSSDLPLVIETTSQAMLSSDMSRDGSSHLSSYDKRTRARIIRSIDTFEAVCKIMDKFGFQTIPGIPRSGTGHFLFDTFYQHMVYCVSTELEEGVEKHVTIFDCRNNVVGKFKNNEPFKRPVPLFDRNVKEPHDALRTCAVLTPPCDMVPPVNRDALDVRDDTMVTLEKMCVNINGNATLHATTITTTGEDVERTRALCYTAASFCLPVNTMNMYHVMDAATGACNALREAKFVFILRVKKILHVSYVLELVVQMADHLRQVELVE